MGTTATYLPSEMAAAIDAIPIFSNITSEDNGMVVVNGHLQDQTTRTIVANGTYDTTTNDEVQVNVSGSGNVTLAEKSVTENGTYLPSGDSADGYSKVTVNVPTVSAADNGKAVSGGRLVEQTTKSISANGTYNTTLNNSVIVNVPNSGSGSSIVTYDVPDFIENTDKSKVLLDLYADDYDETNQSWGDMVLETSTDSFFKDYYGVLKLDSQGLEVGGRYAYRFDLQDTSKITIYAVAKRRRLVPTTAADIITVDFGYVHMGNAYYEARPYNAACIDDQGPYAEKPIGRFNVYTLTVDIDNLSASFYANGAFVGSKELSSYAKLRYVKFGQAADAQFLYVGVVDGIEDTQTIFANQRIATTFIQNARMILPDDDMPSPMFLNNSESDDILVNADYRDFNSSDNTFGPLVAHGGVLTDDCEGVLVSDGVALTYALPTSVGGLTVYAVVKNVYGTDRVAGTYNELDTILFQLGSTSGNVEGVYLHGKTGSTGTYPETNSRVFDLFPVEDFGVYAISFNYATNKANFYFEGSLKATVDISDGPYDVLTFGGKYVSGEISDEACVQLLFAGVVSGVEDSTVIAQNSIELREFMNDSRIALGTEVKSIVSKTITQNGTYLPVNDNAYAYSQVTVNVSASATQDGYVPEFLEYSNANNILMNIDYTDFDSETGEWGDVVVDVGELYQDAFGIVNDPETGTHVTIPSDVDNATVYFICKQWRNYWNGYDICDVGQYHDNNVGAITTVGLCFRWGKESVHAGILKSGVVGAYTETYDAGIPPTLFNAYAIKLDYTNKTVSFYCNDKYIGTVTATNIYRDIYFGGKYDSTSSNPTLGFTSLHFLHMGIVSGDEQPDTIFNNLGSMVSFINDSRIFSPEAEVLVPTFLQHSQPSSILLNANYADFSGRWGGFSTDAGRMSYDCFGVRVDEDTVLSFDVSQTTTGITIYMIAKPYFYGKYRYYPDEENWPYAVVWGPQGSVFAKDTTNGTTPFYLALASSARVLSEDGKTYGAYDRVNPVFSFCAYAITAAYDTGLVTLYMNDSEPVTLELNKAISVDSIVIGGDYDFWYSYMEDYIKGEHSDSQFLHFGIVNGVESSDTIAQNLSDMVSFLTNARFMIPPTPSDIP